MFFPDKLSNETLSIDLRDHNELLDKAPIVDLEITKGRSIPARLVRVPLRTLRLNPANPRVRHKLDDPNEVEIEDYLWREEGTRNLFDEIKYSGGLSEKPIIDSNLVVIEGNRRITCLRRLDDQAKNGELLGEAEDTFEKVQCLMLPSHVNSEDVDLLLARVHVSGKREWSPLNQAEQVFEMVSKHGMAIKAVASALSLSSYRVDIMLKAFQETLEYGKLYPDQESKWIHKFSYFYELFRSQRLREWAKYEENLRTFMEIIAGDSPKLYLGSQVRELHTLIANEEALNLLRSDGFDKAIALVQRKQSKLDATTRTLIDAANLLNRITKEPTLTLKDRRQLKILGTIKEKTDELLKMKRLRRVSSRRPLIQNRPANDRHR